MPSLRVLSSYFATPAGPSTGQCRPTTSSPHCGILDTPCSPFVQVDLQPCTPTSPRQPTRKFSSSPPLSSHQTTELRASHTSLHYYSICLTITRQFSVNSDCCTYFTDFHVSSPPAQNCHSLAILTGEPIYPHLSASYDQRQTSDQPINTPA